LGFLTTSWKSLGAPCVFNTRVTVPSSLRSIIPPPKFVVANRLCEMGVNNGVGVRSVHHTGTPLVSKMTG
jgi:hypothetical protein